MIADWRKRTSRSKCLLHERREENIHVDLANMRGFLRATTIRFDGICLPGMFNFCPINNKKERQKNKTKQMITQDVKINYVDAHGGWAEVYGRVEGRRARLPPGKDWES